MAAAFGLCAGPLLAQEADWLLFPAAGGLFVAHAEQPDEIFLPFTTGEADIRKTAEKLWGEPARSGTMSECGAGPIDFAEFGDGTMLHFQEGSFEGWFIPFDGTAKTFESIGIGTPLGTVLRVLPGEIEVEETTLGYEFWATDLYGVVTSPKESGVVEALWSGTSCIFR